MVTAVQEAAPARFGRVGDSAYRAQQKTAAATESSVRTTASVVIGSPPLGRRSWGAGGGCRGGGGSGRSCRHLTRVVGGRRAVTAHEGADVVRRLALSGLPLPRAAT